MLIGNVGKEPDIRYYDSDQAMAQFPLATTERGYTLQNGTQVPDHTDWHNVLMWRGLAKVAEKYIHKGDRIYVEGRIRYRSYDDQKGQRRYVTEIWADNIELLTTKHTGGESEQKNAAKTVEESQDVMTDPTETLPF